MSQSLNSPLGREKQSRFSSRAKCNLGALSVMLAPLLVWPVTALLVVGGCAGRFSSGLSCPPIMGIHLHAVPTDLLLVSVRGFIVSVPLGLALLALCHYLSRRRKD